MAFVALTLVLIYTCVLLIKLCDMSSLTRAQLSAELTVSTMRHATRATCGTFGFGDTASGEKRLGLELIHKGISTHTVRFFVCSGVFQFFVFFGLSMLAVQLLVLVLRFSFADHVPRFILIAMTHSVAPSTILKRLIGRR